MAEQLPRTPYDAIGDLVYFPRMIDKIRLRAAGKLPEVYFEFMGDGFDGRCVRFLQVDYDALQKRAREGGTDEELLDWCYAQNRRPSPEEIETWSGFMLKRGWRDSVRERIDFRLKEAGLEKHTAKVATMFDFIDIDEGRTPPDFSKWQPPTS